MKIAITTQGGELDSPVDLHFGRARFFRIVDTETGQQIVLDNSDGLNAIQGAGTRASQTLARLGVTRVLTGHVGPKARTALEAAKIEVFPINNGTVEETVRAYLDGYWHHPSRVG